MLKLQLSLPLLCSLLFLSGCEQLNQTNKSNAIGNRPELDCIVANDFYAVHFSTYLQPAKGAQAADAKAAFTPYCQKIPHPGKMYFTADLFDRDVRTTPIAIRLVEVEKTGNKAPDDFREIRTITEIPQKLYPRGAVEAQAEIDKNGDYLLILMVGEAVAEDDQFKIPLEVGVDPGALPWQTIALAAGGGLLLIAGVFLFVRRRAKAKSAAAD